MEKAVMCVKDVFQAGLSRLIGDALVWSEIQGGPLCAGWEDRTGLQTGT